MKGLYVGPYFVGSTVHYRVNALCCLGLDIHPIDTDRYFPSNQRGMHSLWRRLCWGLPVWRLNTDLLCEAERLRPDFVWIDKGNMVSPDTLRRLKRQGIFLINYSPDDMLNPANQSRYYLAGIPLYDLHITTKSFNVSELKEASAQAVTFVEHGYVSSVFYPREVSPLDRQRLGWAVGFIGMCERERARSILHLAMNDIPVRVWGPGWRANRKPYSPTLKIEGRALWGEDFPLAICGTDINLCFLRKANRDLQTTRTYEIPACGGFMLAERTQEHLSLFEEDKEAVFFSSDDELLDKVRYYMEHADERQRIAAAGLLRCQLSGYSYQERFRPLVQELALHVDTEISRCKSHP